MSGLEKISASLGLLNRLGMRVVKFKDIVKCMMICVIKERPVPLTVTCKASPY